MVGIQLELKLVYCMGKDTKDGDDELNVVDVDASIEGLANTVLMVVVVVVVDANCLNTDTPVDILDGNLSIDLNMVVFSMKDQ